MGRRSQNDAIGICHFSLLLSGAAIGLGLLAAVPANAQSVGRCGFQTAKLEFKGSPKEQAECLLRKVRKFGNVDAATAVLPAPLDEQIGQPTGDLKAKLEAYLTSQSLDVAKLGGGLNRPVSTARAGAADAPHARYFVIHDTSSPFLGEGTTFPPNDAPILNKLSGYAGPEAVAHMFVNRKGETLTGHDFSVPWRATKLETEVIGKPSKGLFLHIELIQPRHRDPSGGRRNDALAPMPGFTPEQYAKLALLYAMASARAGVWMTPAFHAAIDQGLSDGHDDPQNFDLAAFATALTDLRAKLGAAAPPASTEAPATPATAPVETAALTEEAICARLNEAAATVRDKGQDLIASNGRSFKQLYDECDSGNTFAGRTLPSHNGRQLKCSTDKNRVTYLKKFDDGTILFNAKMSVDADGSPVIGGSGWPNNVQTWLTFDSGPATERFVNAEEVPFVVVPLAVPNSDIGFLRQTGIGKGDLAVAFKEGKCSFGVAGDAGPWFRIGEASLKTHEDLGNPQCANAGQRPCTRLRGGSGIGIGSDVTYLIFPNTRPVPLTSQNVNEVSRRLGIEKTQQFLTKYHNP
ncbi:hypothetical protein [Rhizobium sp. RAF56]|uniref:hypothetical protein n=1 Tax=Rhizobium sp. RAF56 TaxID=3233062 RepID=UPI003F9C7DA5